LFRRKEICDWEFGFVSQFGEILLPKNLAHHMGLPMGGVLVNAGSHNPSNVFYMAHKALGGGHYQNQATA
jgi:hypothetical protein